eukprot:XP_025015418.1 cytochrome P450 71D9 isoform X2 [Ricinus communis]
MEQQILSFPVLLSFFLFIFMVLKIRKKYNKNISPPPGPWKLPILGNIHQLISPLPHHRLRDLAKIYGPVMSIKLGEVSAVVISSAEAAKEVLRTQDVSFADRPLGLSAKMVLYNGNDVVFGSYGEQWRQLRKICILELLSAKRVQSFKSLREAESRLERLHQDTDQILEDIINEHRACKAVSKNGDQNEADNLLDVLLDLQEDGNLRVPLTNDSIKGTILDMFAGGSDTTSKTAEWAVSELMFNPKAMKKAQEEVRRVFGQKGIVDESGFHELKFLKLVIKETLRLHPALPLIPRECMNKSKINGYNIDPKTKVLINVWAIGRDSNIWPEAEKFYPERFLDSSIDYKGTSYEFIPFGAGKRICPGMMLGTTNLELFLAQLLYHFDWQFPDGVTPETFDMTEAFSGSINRKYDLNLIPIPFHPLRVE